MSTIEVIWYEPREDLATSFSRMIEEKFSDGGFHFTLFTNDRSFLKKLHSIAETGRPHACIISTESPPELFQSVFHASDISAMARHRKLLTMRMNHIIQVGIGPNYIDLDPYTGDLGPFFCPQFISLGISLGLDHDWKFSKWLRASLEMGIYTSFLATHELPPNNTRISKVTASVQPKIVRDLIRWLDRFGKDETVQGAAALASILGVTGLSLTAAVAWIARFWPQQAKFSENKKGGILIVGNEKIEIPKEHLEIFRSYIRKIEEAKEEAL